MAEFLIVAPLLLFLCLGTLQFALLYQAKSTLDVAALEAARAGAVAHGSMAAMQSALARGLAPLYARNASEEGFSQALMRSNSDIAGSSTIAVVSPSDAMVRDFAFARPSLEDGTTHSEIPNDTLMYRDSSLGPQSNVSIQDANLLKIRVHYCYDMYVPLVNKVLYYAVNVIGSTGTGGLLTREPADGDQDPYGHPQRPDPLCRIKLGDGTTTGKWPLALESEAMVRMQSSYRLDAASDPLQATDISSR